MDMSVGQSASRPVGQSASRPVGQFESSPKDAVAQFEQFSTLSNDKKISLLNYLWGNQEVNKYILRNPIENAKNQEQLEALTYKPVHLAQFLDESSNELQQLSDKVAQIVPTRGKKDIRVALVLVGESEGDEGISLIKPAREDEKLTVQEYKSFVSLAKFQDTLRYILSSGSSKRFNIEQLTFYEQYQKLVQCNFSERNKTFQNAFKQECSKLAVGIGDFYVEDKTKLKNWGSRLQGVENLVQKSHVVVIDPEDKNPVFLGDKTEISIENFLRAEFYNIDPSKLIKEGYGKIFTDKGGEVKKIFQQALTGQSKKKPDFSGGVSAAQMIKAWFYSICRAVALVFSSYIIDDTTMEATPLGRWKEGDSPINTTCSGYAAMVITESLLELNRQLKEALKNSLIKKQKDPLLEGSHEIKDKAAREAIEARAAQKAESIVKAQCPELFDENFHILNIPFGGIGDLGTITPAELIEYLKAVGAIEIEMPLPEVVTNYIQV